MRSNSTSERVCDRDGVQSERDAPHSYLGQFEKQCITVPETYVERKFRREAENGWV